MRNNKLEMSKNKSENKQTINITLNGKQARINNRFTIENLLSDLKLNPSVVSVLKNEKLVTKNNYKNTVFKNKDIIEIIRIMGGG